MCRLVSVKSIFTILFVIFTLCEILISNVMAKDMQNLLFKPTLEQRLFEKYPKELEKRLAEEKKKAQDRIKIREHGGGAWTGGTKTKNVDTSICIGECVQTPVTKRIHIEGYVELEADPEVYRYDSEKAKRVAKDTAKSCHLSGVAACIGSGIPGAVNESCYRNFFSTCVRTTDQLTQILEELNVIGYVKFTARFGHSEH